MCKWVTLHSLMSTLGTICATLQLTSGSFLQGLVCYGHTYKLKTVLPKTVKAGLGQDRVPGPCAECKCHSAHLSPPPLPLVPKATLRIIT